MIEKLKYIPTCSNFNVKFLPIKIPWLFTIATDELTPLADDAPLPPDAPAHLRSITPSPELRSNQIRIK